MLFAILHRSYISRQLSFEINIRGGSRTAAIFKMAHFVIIVNGWKPLIVITKRSILDVAAPLDLPLNIIRKIKVCPIINKEF